MKWIKVEEKAPITSGYYHVKRHHSSVNAVHYWDSTRELYINGWSSICDEWLDESIDESAIQLIKDIRHGNIYKDPVDACANFLSEHGFEKL